MTIYQEPANARTAATRIRITNFTGIISNSGPNLNTAAISTVMALRRVTNSLLAPSLLWLTRSAISTCSL